MTEKLANADTAENANDFLCEICAPIQVNTEHVLTKAGWYYELICRNTKPILIDIDYVYT